MVVLSSIRMIDLVPLELETEGRSPQRRRAANRRLPNIPSGTKHLVGRVCISTPDVVDHRQNQTPIRDQIDRGTCVCFASLAGIESVLKRRSGNDVDLSEQYANWLFMAKQGRNQCDEGTPHDKLPPATLRQSGVCEEHHLPYEDKTRVNSHCNATPFCHRARCCELRHR